MNRALLPILVVCCVVVSGCNTFHVVGTSGNETGRPSPAASPAATPSSIDAQFPILPNLSQTPGDTLAVTASDICQPGYAHAVRNVPSSVKRQVYESYGILHHTRGQFEVDHLISLELGGSNSVKNLWPESYRTQPWNARVKDQLEDHLHDDVCSGRMDIAAAQHAIAVNWIDSYKREFHTQTPLTATQYGKRSGGRRHRGDESVRAADETPDTSPGSGAASGASAAPTVAYPNAAATAPVPIANAATPQHSGISDVGVEEVWVNTRSHKYFRNNSRYYGKTKQGKYMTESAAKAAGYTAAKSE